MEQIWAFGNAETWPDEAASLDAFAEAAANGDRIAFEGIYRMQVDDIYAYARAHALSDADAEDIVATVFLKAWQRARQYRQGSRNYRRWLFGIARNEVRNHWRERRAARALEAELELDAAARDSLANGAVNGVDLPALRKAMGRLTPDQRDVITLRYFGEMTPQEIAAILGKAEGSIRALQFRALRRLRKAVSNAST